MFGIVITYSVVSQSARGLSHPWVGGRWVIINAITTVLWATHERDAVLALHRRRDRVAEELGLWPELSEDADLVRGRNVVKS